MQTMIKSLVTVGLMGLAAGLAAGPAALATDIPDPDLSSYVIATDEPVSLFTVPDGTGSAFDAAFTYGGTLADATITLFLVDAVGNPFVDFPAEEMWLETTADGLVACFLGTIADANSDANGVTHWQLPLAAGGYTDPGNELTVVVVSNYTLTSAGGLELYFNSPDVNGDTVVNLTDAALFAEVLFGAYGYRADFVWDGVVNLSDVAMMAQHFGGTCP